MHGMTSQRASMSPSFAPATDKDSDGEGDITTSRKKLLQIASDLFRGGKHACRRNAIGFMDQTVWSFSLVLFLNKQTCSPSSSEAAYRTIDRRRVAASRWGVIFVTALATEIEKADAILVAPTVSGMLASSSPTLIFRYQYLCKPRTAGSDAPWRLIFSKT